MELQHSDHPTSSPQDKDSINTSNKTDNITKKNSNLPNDLSEKSKQNCLIFSKRKGTTDKGKEYEKYFVTNFILKWLKSDKIVDFTVWSNDEAFGDLDDVILEVKYSNNSEEKYALQLKHQSGKKNLILNSLQADKGNFSIKKYFESYKNNKELLHNYQLILWTNLEFFPAEDTIINFSHGTVTFKLKIKNIKGSSVLSTNDTGKCYKFDILNKDPNLEEYEKFFEEFFVYSDQLNFENLKLSTNNIVEKLIPGDKTLINDFIEYINNWTLSDGKVWKLNKGLITTVVALQMLTKYNNIFPLSFEQVEENKLLQDAINKFDVTVFKSESKLVSEIWNNVKQKLLNNKDANIMIKQYQLSTQKIDDNLDDITCSILLWIMNERPLIVRSNRHTYEAIKLCKDKKFILIQDNTDYPPLEDFKSFKKLSDLKQFEDIFSKITNEIKFQLPGTETNISTLVNKDVEIADIITTDVLLNIIDQKFVLEQKLEKLPETYINRKLYRNYININYLDESSKEVLILVSNVTKENERLDCFSKCELIQLEDFLKGRQNKNNKSHSMGRRKVFINSKESSREKFHELSNKNENNKSHHFKFVNGKLEWIESIGEISELNQHFIEDSSINVDEDMFFEEKSHNNVNIVIADPGMGKSTLLKTFKNNISRQYLTILFTPKDINKLCEQFNREDFEEHITEVAFPNCTILEQSVSRTLIREGHVAYLWDALDEMPDDTISTLTNIITFLSKISKVQIVTARRHLKKNLEDKFGVLSSNIQPFDSDQQTHYIENRLENVIPNKDELANVCMKIKKNVSTNTYIHILGIPLQIYMITELFLKNTQKYTDLLTEIFCLTDLYHYFVEEKFNVYFKEKTGMDENSPQQKRMYNSFKSTRIKNYTNAALKSFFGNEFLDQQKTDCDDFLEEVDENGDFVGFIADLRKKEMIPEFVHTSYGEYFIALYLVENCKMVSNLEKFIFNPKHANVRFFFDMLLAKNSPAHIAVLCENMNELSKYKDMLNNNDLQGRHPLHIACSWSEQFPLLEVKKINDTTYLIDNESGEYSVKQKDAKNKQLLEYLLDNCDPEMKDTLFGYNCVMYAEKSGCLSALALIEKRRKSDYYKTKSDEFVCNMLYYGVEYNFADAIDVLLDEAKYICDNDKMSLLHMAVLNNDIKCVQKLLSCTNYREHIDDENEDTQTPLHAASENGHLDVVKVLLENNANIHAKNKYGETSLFVASSEGHVNVVKLLLECGANIDTFSLHGATPLHVASQNGHLDVVNVLLENNADIHAVDEYGQTTLFVASGSGNVNVVNALLERGTNVNTSSLNGFTPLLAACLNGHVDVVKVLLENNANIHAMNEYGQTSLFVASWNGHVNVVNALLERGANVDTSSLTGFTPLLAACWNGHVDVVKVLLENNANLHAIDKYGRTSLFLASRNGHVNVVKVLLECGANIDILSLDGVTPLHVASDNGRLDIVKVLVENNANVNARNKEGKTPLHLASWTEHVKVVQFLIENNADINATTDEGHTPLHVASYRGSLYLVRILMECGANPNSVDKEGVTPLFRAIQNYHQDVISFLIENNPIVDITIIISLACKLFHAYNNVH